MPTPSTDRDLVLGITPFHQPNADLVVAVERAGYLGVLDLGPDSGAARAALGRVSQRLGGRPFGVRLRGELAAGAAVLPPEVDTIVLDPVTCHGPWPSGAPDSGPDSRQDNHPHGRSDGRRVRVLAEVAAAHEAADALRLGASGLVARGFEAGGRVGELSTFVLVQRLVAAFPGVPVWAMGGIGPHTAAAAVAGGARGVAIDAQLALTAEAGPGAAAGMPADVAHAITAMDGSETRVISGYRVYTRPGLPAIDPASGRFGARDLREQLLPVGQDGAFAAPLAARYRTAGGVTRAIGAAIGAQIELAARIEPLRDARPVQGPMTRVSDRAAFADAVAGSGGLPFLALALMPGDQAAELLTETRQLLGRRPWGAGILGFAPPEIRDAQLAAILRIRPPYALIAGGRPAQAAALQEAGIETFLHVPSPGLLGQFLDSGARRFIFEGAECGGHTGPRGSFALWQAAVARLLEQPDLTGVHAWFAGGVHDERSAAMIAAMAAPLAERGARVGLLMGTAYLFTREIVDTGATTGLYQRTARECTGTALLESSPGHVIRCADTPYVGTFAAAKEHLAAAGASQQDAWAELEQLSLGRLRVAAKGLRREGDGLVGVDEETARGDGMFMLGQVATLRSSATTVAALHEQVTAGAAGFLAARAAGLRDAAAAAGHGSAGETRSQPLDVAIVGMACVYPGADGVDRFWANVIAGADAVGEVPEQRWRKEQYPDVPSARGGFMPPVPFDALSYGIPPSALASIEPVQLLALEVAARALADAGYASRPFDRSRSSVIFGTEAGSDLSAAYGLRSGLPGYLEPRAGERIPAELDEFLPRMTEDSFPGVLGNVIAGRIANRLDLGGVNYAVDAACASSLAALDLACKELSAGTSDLVLCGGADTHNSIHDYEMFASVHALSPQGRCATFDAKADGIALGEGVGCVVLKRLADAERDGDRIYAVVKGIGGSSDGRSLGLTAPRPEGQRLALDRAYAMAGVSPDQVGLVEAHGTGTVAGDRAELATLTAVFTDAGAEPGGCAVGSVKSQIGHTKCAAGLAGLIKVACALHTGTRPGTIHLTAPNAYWEPATSPFTFTTGKARPWPADPERRHAAVSAFGFGGTNFHAVLSGYDGADAPAHGLRDWPAELFALRGDVTEAARELGELAAANNAAGRPWRLAELAATTAARPGPVRAAFTAGSLDELDQRLREPLAAAGHEAAGHGAAGHGAAGQPGELRPAGIAFLFPGQGSQRAGMTADLFTAFPRLQRLLRLAGPRCAAAMFPPAAFTRADRERQSAAITDTRMAQPALGVADLAVWELLTLTGVHPDMAAGHSYGELAALCAAGAYDEAALLELSAARAAAILAAAGDDPGAMATVSGDARRVAALLDGTGVVIANHNAPDQVVISGPTAGVDAAVDALTAAGLPARRIGVACAFHSPLVAPAAAAMAEALDRQDVAAPRFPVYANCTAAPYAGTPDEVRRLLAAQVADPVLFAEQVEAMYAAGARTFVEAGPGRTLTGLVGRILAGRPHTAVACDVPGENGLTRFLTALSELVAAGIPVDPRPLFAGRAAPVTGTPARPSWTVDGHLVRTADGEPVAGGLRPATAAPRLALGRGRQDAGQRDAVHHGTGPADRESVVADFLRTTRELITVQREVLLGYLEAAPVPPAAPPDSNPYPERKQLPQSAHAPAPPAARPSAPAAPAAPAARPGRKEIGAAVVAVISGRTGYPSDMLGSDLDLEADLSIDSIKRTEIIAALAGQLGLAARGAAVDERVMEELSRIKTISGITDWLDGHLAAAADGAFGADRTPPADRTAAAGSVPDEDSALAGDGTPAPAFVPRQRFTEPQQAAVDDSPAPALPRRIPDHAVLARQPSPATGDGRAKTGRPRRFLVEPAGLAAAQGPAVLPQGRFLIVDDGRGIALELADLLEQRGAESMVTETPGAGDLLGASALVHLGALRPGGRAVLPAVFGLVRDALAVGARTVLVATAGGGTFGYPAPPGGAAGHGTPAEPAGGGTLLGWAFGEEPGGNGGGNRGTARSRPGGGSAAYAQKDQTDYAQTDYAQADHGALAPGAWRGWDDEPADLGLRGLIRTVAAEYPGVLARAVDVEAKNSPREIAAQLLTELSVPAGPPVVGYLAGRRTGLRVVEVAPPGTGLAGSSGLGLDSDSVVLLTGGARGITAAAALALARESGCHIELIGRTPPPGPADPGLDTADPVALRQVLIARGGLNGRRGPREIEAETARLLRERQVRGTLDRLRATAASVRYHAADVRDAGAVGAVLADVYARFGRIDGVIHGAGVVEDRLIADKTPDSFTRVYRTKVDGARALAAGLRGDLRFLVLFGSVSGVFGNRGQADYAAANDALDALARHWSLRTGHGGVAEDDRQGGRGSAAPGGPRVLAVDWGPWAGGMVSPELEREYARRGVPLIDPADGVTCLLAEIADPAGPSQVVYLCGELPQPAPGQTGPGQAGNGQPGPGQAGNGNADE